MNHTPTPWILSMSDFIKGANGRFVADCETSLFAERPAPPKPEDLANAEFIIRACNAHEELVDVLKLCKRNVEAQLYMLPYDASEQKDILSSWIGRINGALSLTAIEKGDKR